MTFRKIPRDVHENARDYARALMRTPKRIALLRDLLAGAKSFGILVIA
jgi:hypothetical protein